MSDLLFADVLRLDAQVSFCRVAEVGEQAFDRRDRAVRVVAEADAQGLRADIGEGQGARLFHQRATAWALLVTCGRRAPVADYAGGRVLQPAEPLAWKVATQ